jgi:hypothetical protein
MNTENSPKTKFCPKCAKSDFTDFSTCRYCGNSYDHRLEKPAGGGSNAFTPTVSPFAIILIALLVACPFAIAYLKSQGMDFLVSSSRYGHFRRGGGALSAVPTALVVFASKKVLDSAQETVAKETQVLATDGRNYDALIQRGDAYWTLLKGELAIADYTSAIAVRPQSPETYEKRAIVYDSVGKTDLAQNDRDAAKKWRELSAK